MARRAEARAPMVAGADLWLAEAAIPCRPRRAGISRNDLSASLYSDTRRAEQGADGAPADSAADAPGQSKPLPIDYEQRCSDRLNPPSKSDIARSNVMSALPSGHCGAQLGRPLLGVADINGRQSEVCF
jgi:hypothetical protein